jgi:glyoxylase-like metal-dependent hydrolase (beta-lactamase superfamily II)
MPGYTVLERGWLSSNTIIFHAGDTTAVVDTGYCTHAEQTLSLIDAALGQQSLQRIINTHLHSDHCGGNAALQARYPKAITLIPPGQSQYVTNWDQDALSYEVTGQQCPRFHFDQLLIPGQTVCLGDDAWEIYAAPGHDPDSVILFEPKSRTLISADALWEHGFGVVFPELDQHDAFDEVASTLDLIERLSPHTIIPGHGRVFHEVHAALAVARRRLEKFVQQPLSHAQYAAKVLIKYKLLELQSCTQSHLMSWALATPYFYRLHSHFFSHQTIEDSVDTAIAALIKSDAARSSGDLIFNHEK